MKKCDYRTVKVTEQTSSTGVAELVCTVTEVNADVTL